MVGNTPADSRTPRGFAVSHQGGTSVLWTTAMRRLEAACSAQVPLGNAPQMEIDSIRLRELLRKPDRLAGAARTEKKETTRREAYCSMFHIVYFIKHDDAYQWQTSIADGKMRSFFHCCRKISRMSHSLCLLTFSQFYNLHLKRKAGWCKIYFHG